MTITHWFILLTLAGVAYALLHLRATLNNRWVIRASGENGVYEHTATGDVRAAARDLVMASCFFSFALIPLLPFGREWVALVGGLAFLVLVTAFVCGMAFARIHEMSRPRRR